MELTCLPLVRTTASCSGRPPNDGHRRRFIDADVQVPVCTCAEKVRIGVGRISARLGFVSGCGLRVGGRWHGCWRNGVRFCEGSTKPLGGRSGDLFLVRKEGFAGAQE